MNLPQVALLCALSETWKFSSSLALQSQKEKKFSPSDWAVTDRIFLTAFGQILINLCVACHLEISGASQHALSLPFMSGCNNTPILMHCDCWVLGHVRQIIPWIGRGSGS